MIAYHGGQKNGNGQTTAMFSTSVCKSQGTPMSSDLRLKRYVYYLT